MALALLSQKWPLLKIEDELSSTALWYGVTRLICYCFFPYTPNVMDVTSLSKANHAGGPLDAMPSGARCSNTATNGSNVNAPMLTRCSVGKDLHLSCTTNIYGERRCQDFWGKTWVDHCFINCIHLCKLLFYPSL